jgi:Na+-transporting NADH:ubiquinone oxidoreductase subunit NqrF
VPIIELVGLASKTSKFIDYVDTDLDTDLLTFLRAKKITIGSSCDGEGVCKKCDIQNGWLTCQLTLRSFLELQPDGKVFVSYL